MPSEWTTVRLGECIDILTGFPFKSADYTVSATGVRLLRGDNVAQGVLRWDGVKKWPAENCSQFEQYALKESDIILAMDRPWIPAGLKFGRVRKTDLPALLVQRVACLRPKNHVNADFLYSVIGSQRFSEFIKNVATGTAVPHISSRQIKDFEFLLPDLPTQEQIGQLLATFDERITLLQETNVTLKSFAQSLFKSLFIDFDPVRAKAEGREPVGLSAEDSGLFPDGFEESELGPIPRGWAVTTIEVVADVVKGKSYSSKDLVLVSPTALVTLKSFERGGGFRMDGFKPYAGTYKATQVVKPGDLIVAYTDVTQAAELIGKPATVIGVEDYETLVASLDVGIIRPRDASVSKPFLYELFRTEPFQAHTFAHTSGTTVLHLAKEAVGSYRFACPPRELVQSFTVVAQTTNARIQTNVNLARTLSALRDALLPRLISGQLRLPDAEALLQDAA